jgi:hypothetical protein
LAAVGRFKVPVGTGYRNACRRFVAGSARRQSCCFRCRVSACNPQERLSRCRIPVS